MAKTNRERVLEHLRSISPQGATNSQIREATGISPHQQVFQLTQKLISKGLIRGTRDGREWTFYAIDAPSAETNRDRVFEYLQSISLQGATNRQIREATGISPHPQVYQLTQDLMRRGRIQGGQHGHAWTFYAGDAPEIPRPTSPQTTQEEISTDIGQLSPSAFERLARQVMSQHFGVPLNSSEVIGVPKRFDFVSADGSVVGDAKYYTLVQGKRLPPAKFSVIAEHMWLLEKINARHRFLVFGNDIRVPQEWLARYGALVAKVAFYFLDDRDDWKSSIRPPAAWI